MSKTAPQTAVARGAVQSNQTIEEARDGREGYAVSGFGFDLGRDFGRVGFSGGGSGGGSGGSGKSTTM